MLDEDERTRASCFHFAADAESFLAAHALARAMLSSATGRSSDFWRYSIGAFGKPELAPECDMPALRFNVSHTRGLVACAVGFHDVGLDVESQQREIGLAEDILAPEEALILRLAPGAARPGMFFRFWTLKEAFIKATGEGLHRPLNSFSFQLDPIQITFHPQRAASIIPDEPTMWQFAECRPTEQAYLALAVRRAPSQSPKLDMRAAQLEDIDRN
jgi:4'-phosphopantetheinyl transferase